MSPNEVVDCHLHKLVQVVYLCKFISLFFFFSFFFLFSFFFFCIVLKFGSFFQVLREPSHHLGVPFLGGEGCVRDVQGGGFGGKELQIEERSDRCHGRG